MTFFEGAQLLTVRFVPSVVYHHSSFAMHKHSFALIKTKFSPSADTDTDSPIFRTLSLMK